MSRVGHYESTNDTNTNIPKISKHDRHDTTNWTHARHEHENSSIVICPTRPDTTRLRTKKKIMYAIKYTFIIVNFCYFSE